MGSVMITYKLSIIQQHCYARAHDKVMPRCKTSRISLLIHQWCVPRDTNIFPKVQTFFSSALNSLVPMRNITCAKAQDYNNSNIFSLTLIFTTPNPISNNCTCLITTKTDIKYAIDPTMQWFLFLIQKPKITLIHLKFHRQKSSLNAQNNNSFEKLSQVRKSVTHLQSYHKCRGVSR